MMTAALLNPLACLCPSRSPRRADSRLRRCCTASVTPSRDGCSCFSWGSCQVAHTYSHILGHSAARDRGKHLLRQHITDVRGAQLDWDQACESLGHDFLPLSSFSKFLFCDYSDTSGQLPLGSLTATCRVSLLYPEFIPLPLRRPRRRYRHRSPLAHRHEGRRLSRRLLVQPRALLLEVHRDHVSGEGQLSRVEELGRAHNRDVQGRRAFSLWCQETKSVDV